MGVQRIGAQDLAFHVNHLHHLGSSNVYQQHMLDGLEFNGPVVSIEVMPSRSVYITTFPAQA